MGALRARQRLRGRASGKGLDGNRNGCHGFLLGSKQGTGNDISTASQTALPGGTIRKGREKTIESAWTISGNTDPAGPEWRIDGGAGPQDSVRLNAEQSISIQEEKYKKERYFYFQKAYIH